MAGHDETAELRVAIVRLKQAGMLDVAAKARAAEGVVDEIAAAIEDIYTRLKRLEHGE